jgi:hypothetical protein
MNSRSILSRTLHACTLLAVIACFIEIHEYEETVASMKARVHRHVERRKEMCDRLDMMFSGAAAEAEQPLPYKADVRHRIQTDLAIFSPSIEGCVEIPHATDRAIIEMDRDSVLQTGIRALHHAMMAAKARGWPL